MAHVADTLGIAAVALTSVFVAPSQGNAARPAAIAAQVAKGPTGTAAGTAAAPVDTLDQAADP
jgi:hypothetical protein